MDAVGVTESQKTVTSPGNGETEQNITLKRLLELLTHGNVNDDYLRLIAAKLARIYNKCTDKQREEFQRMAHSGMQEISAAIFDALEKNTLPPYESIEEPNLERKGLVAPLTHHPEARQFLLILAAGFVETLMPGEDQLISKGFSQEEAKELTSAFEKYCEEHQDEIEALRMIYNNEGEPLTYYILKDLENKLKMANNRFQSSRIWNSYAIVSPQSVKKHTTKEEKEALTNITFRQPSDRETGEPLSIGPAAFQPLVWSDAAYGDRVPDSHHPANSGLYRFQRSLHHQGYYRGRQKPCGPAYQCLRREGASRRSPRVALEILTLQKNSITFYGNQ